MREIPPSPPSPSDGCGWWRSIWPPDSHQLHTRERHELISLLSVKACVSLRNNTRVCPRWCLGRMDLYRKSCSSKGIWDTTCGKHSLVFFHVETCNLLPNGKKKGFSVTHSSFPQHLSAFMKVQLTDCSENNFDNPLLQQFTTNTSKASVRCGYYCQATMQQTNGQMSSECIIATVWKPMSVSKLPTPPESALGLQTQFILVTSNNYFKPTWAGNTCTLTKEEWMLNGREQYSCFYFGQCLPRKNMRVWASPFALAYCGPVVLKCLSQDTLFPEVHFLLVLDFRWGVRCTEGVQNGDTGPLLQEEPTDVSGASGQNAARMSFRWNFQTSRWGT